MEKEQYRNTNSGQRISHLCFSVPSAGTLKKQSHIQCINHVLYDAAAPNVGKGRQPAPYGVLDFRLGKQNAFIYARSLFV